MSEHEFGEVMQYIANREAAHREDPSAGFDYLLNHLISMHKHRDKALYDELVPMIDNLFNTDQMDERTFTRLRKRLRELQTF